MSYGRVAMNKIKRLLKDWRTTLFDSLFTVFLISCIIRVIIGYIGMLLL